MDLTDLERINREIPLRENQGDVRYFEERLAPSLAMRRADGTVVGRADFLANIKRGGDRQTVSIDSLTPLGKDRALVVSVVSVVSSGGKLFQNLRVFVRDSAAPEGWLLLAWANAPVTPVSSPPLGLGSILSCPHGGRVVVARQASPDGPDVLTEADLRGAVIAGCPAVGPFMKPCARVVSIAEGLSDTVRGVNGSQAVCANVRALTDGTPPGVCWLVVDAAAPARV